MLKKIALMSLIALSLPLTTFATPLTIVNNTAQFSTAVLNGMMCSSRLPGGVGITSPHSTNVVSERILKLACLGHSSNCQADIYMTNDCSGGKVGSAYLNTATGIYSVAVSDPRYAVTYNGFYVTISGGPN